MRNNAKKEKLYAVIGLGRFGFSLAKRLAEAGNGHQRCRDIHGQRLYDDRPFQGESAECGNPEL